jgi:tRNA threonylcarbamoyladenosine biosynthesis protein TsaE
MNNMIDLNDEKSTIQFGESLGKTLFAPLVLGFSGMLGAGKTTLIRAMLTSLGVKEVIKSPTFALVESYDLDLFTIHHFDLYRIDDPAELDAIGFRDYFSSDALLCIEWPEKAGNRLALDVEFNLSAQNTGRNLTLITHSSQGERWMASIGQPE